MTCAGLRSKSATTRLGTAANLRAKSLTRMVDRSDARIEEVVAGTKPVPRPMIEFVEAPGMRITVTTPGAVKSALTVAVTR